MAAYKTATSDVVIEVDQTFTINREVNIPAPSTDGVTLTIRSANSNQPVSLIRGVKDNGGLFYIYTGATLILENIIIDGDKNGNFSNAGEPLVTVTGTFIMNNGAVLKNNSRSFDSSSIFGSGVNVQGFSTRKGTFIMNGGKICECEPAAIYISKSNFTMNGGEIIDNTAPHGFCGIGIVNGTFNMNGGKISNNANLTSGSCISLDNSTFNMSGGIISENIGDGVYCSGYSSSTFNMSGGKICKNTGRGMLVFTVTDKFNMSGGEISENTNGGVYVNAGTFTLGGKAVIRGNTVNGLANNVLLDAHNYISLATPEVGMNVGITKTYNNGIFVKNGASVDDTQYFHADASNRTVIYTGAGTLQIVPSFIVNTLSSPAGSGVVSGYGSHGSGQTVTVEAIAKEGYNFKNWTATPAVTFANANSASTTFTMPANVVTVTANFEPIPVRTYTVTVLSSGIGATGAGNYEENATVNIIAGTSPNGQQFKNWTATPAVTFADANSVGTTFTMPANAVTVTANFEPIPVRTYTVTVLSLGIGATGAGNYKEGATVNIIAGTSPNGQQFKNWTATPAVTFADANSVGATFTMPANAVTVTANFETITSVETLFVPNLKIYPNPFADIVHVTGTDGCILQIINSAGTTIHVQKINSPNETVHLEHLTAGTYLFRIENNGQAKTIKVVKN